MLRSLRTITIGAAAALALSATGARAELTAIGQSVFWLSAPQAVCLDNASARMAELPDLFDTGPIEINPFEWYLIGIADTVVVELQCIADDGSDEIVSLDAERVLVIIEVFSEDFGAPSETDSAIVDFLGTCLIYPELCVGEPPPADAEAEVLDWRDSPDGLGLRTQIGTQVTVACPPFTDGAFPASVWGTDIYTSDSYVCAAAVHAGLITPETGGTLTIEMLPGQDAYVASVRNGVESDDWSSFDASFRFLDTPTKAQPKN